MMIDCRICQGSRPTTADGRFCAGCGSPVANAVPRDKQTDGTPRCPICNRRGKRTPGDQFACAHCVIVFEPVDVSYCDTRPDVNAEKRERHHR